MSDGIAGKRQFVGVDLHLHRSVIVRIDDRGRELECVRIENSVSGLVAEVAKAGQRAPVAIEATYGWYWAVDALQHAGFDVHLAHPYGMKAMRKRRRVKTDHADALELARMLRLGSLPEAYIAPVQLRELRELVRHRRQLTKVGTAIKGGIRAAAAKHGIRIAISQLSSVAGSDLLDTLKLPGYYGDRLAAQRRLMLLVDDELSRVEAELVRRLRTDRDYQRLQTIKGIGPVLAAVFVAEIGDVSRFRNAAALTCWAGLTPRVHESDRRRRDGSISKEGCTLVRWAAVESVQRQCEPLIQAVRDDIIARRGKRAKNTAKVAAARRMLEIVYYTLRDGEARCLTKAITAA
jgi:transposase